MSDRTHEPSFEVELRQELDRVRLENQRLQAIVAETQRWQHAFSVLARHTKHVVLRHAKRLRPSRSGGVGATSAAPYVVTVRQTAHAIRPRILHLIGNFHVGGSSRLVVDLIEHLGHLYEQSVLAWDLPASPAYTNLSLGQAAPKDAREAATLLKAVAPQLIHVHYFAHHRDEYSARAWNWYRTWFDAAAALGIPVIENVNIPTEPFVNDAVRCYVYVSEYVLRRFGRLDGNNITIYPGSDLQFFSPGTKSFSDKGGVIGMVYRLQTDKLSQRSILPLIEVVKQRPNTRAIVVGNGPLLAPFEQQVAVAGLSAAFEFTGSVSYGELPALFSRMTVFVAPVYRESFGQVGPFAMGMELPVAGYRVGALEEILGDRSCLATPDAPQELARIIVDLLDDPARCAEIGRANRRRAESHFSIQAMIKRYDQLYAGLAVKSGLLA